MAGSHSLPPGGGFGYAGRGYAFSVSMPRQCLKVIRS